jgi:hypothetical protein
MMIHSGYPGCLLRLLGVVCCALAFIMLTPGSVRAAQADFATEQHDSRVITVVWNIISYTRWPDEKGSLRVCLPEENKYATLIRRSARVVGLRRPVVVRIVPPDATGACDVVYFAAAPAVEMGQRLRELAGSPVLTIGENPSFCSAGGMFCLLLDGAGRGRGDRENTVARFAANLDAISRSHLRVNPQVLRLSKRGQK